MPGTWTKERAQLYIGIGGATLIALLVLVGLFMPKSDNRASSSSRSSSSPVPTYTRPTISPQLIETTVIDTCRQAVQKGLKDPASAMFGDEWKAWKVTASGSKPPAGMDYSPFNSDEYWNAAGVVNAKNSFGGYVGDQPYACDAVVSVDGNVRARAHALELPAP